MSTTSGRKILGAEANASSEQLKLTQQLGEKFAKFNVVDDSLDLDDISNQDKCKKGKKNDFLLISSYTDGSINEIDLSAFELGRLVLSQHTDMFARLKTQVPPQQLTNLLQQLSAAGCKKAQKKLNTIGDNTPEDKKLSSSTTASSLSSKKKKKEKKSPSTSGTKKMSSTSSGHENGRKKRRRISGDTKQSPAVTTPNSGGKGDIKLSSSTTAVAAVTDVDKSGDTVKPTPKTKGTVPTLPFPGSGGSTTESGSDVVGVVGGAGGTASKPKPRTKKANQQQKETIEGAAASSGGVATSGGGKVAESGGDVGDVGSGEGGGAGGASKPQPVCPYQLQKAMSAHGNLLPSKPEASFYTAEDVKKRKKDLHEIMKANYQLAVDGMPILLRKLNDVLMEEDDTVMRDKRIDEIAVKIARDYFHPDFLGEKDKAMEWAKLMGYEQQFKNHWDSFKKGMFMKSEE